MIEINSEYQEFVIPAGTQWTDINHSFDRHVNDLELYFKEEPSLSKLVNVICSNSSNSIHLELCKPLDYDVTLIIELPDYD